MRTKRTWARNDKIYVIRNCNVVMNGVFSGAHLFVGIFVNKCIYGLSSKITGRDREESIE